MNHRTKICLKYITKDMHKLYESRKYTGRDIHNSINMQITELQLLAEY